MKNSHLPIDQRHKQLLRATLLEVHSARTLPVDRKHPFSLMKTLFRWSLVPAVAVAGFGAWIVFAPQSPVQSGLAGVRAALAAEATQAAQNLVHHQKIQITDTTQGDKVATEEHWVDTTREAHTYTGFLGMVDDRSVTLRNTGGSVQSQYEMYPDVVPLAQDGDVVCMINPEDVTASASGSAAVQQEAESLTNTESIIDRRALITTLLENEHVTDLGERDGYHLFSIRIIDDSVAPAETIVYEYAFDPSDFSLDRYTIRYFADTDQEYTYIYTYLVNEYVDESAIDTSVWNTDGLTLLSENAGDVLLGKPSGCYDADGTKVGDVDFTVETLANGRLSLSLDVAQNEYMNNVVFIDQKGLKGVSSIVMTSSDPNYTPPTESRAYLVTGE